MTAGMAIYDTMQLIPNDVVTVVTGMAASMGQFLLTAGTIGSVTLPPMRVSYAPAFGRYWWYGF